MDQFIFNNPGQLSTVYGRDSSDQHFQGGTIYNDASLVMIWIENQVSLGINDTVMVKSWFKKWFWEQYATKVSHYHGNNEIFTADEYHKNFDDKGQTQSVQE